jgi:hypothetical protein
MKNGFGTFIYAYGDRYEGNWVNDQRCGFGKIVYADNNIY